MMKNGTMTLTEETKKFNHVVDAFFEMNPENRLWILLMLYLGKERALHVVDNTEVETYARNKSYHDQPYWHVMAQLSIKEISNQAKKAQWLKEGISERFIWADTPASLDTILDEMVYGTDIDSANMKKANNIHKGNSTHSQCESVYLTEIAETFISLSDEWYKENASMAFDYIIQKIQKTYGIQCELYSQPLENTQLEEKSSNAQNGNVYSQCTETVSSSDNIEKECTNNSKELTHLKTYISKLFILINN